MDEESEIEKLREEIKRKYTPVVMLDPMTSVIFTANRVTLNRMAVYAASLRAGQRAYLSWLALKKPFLQQLWNAYGRGF